MLAKTRLLFLAFVAAACSDDAPERRIVNLSGAEADCQNPMEICRESYPPQCDTYCADEQPGDDADCVVDSDGNVSCGEIPCIILTDASGEEVVACPGDDCTVSYDVETGTETIECAGDDGCADPAPDGSCDDDPSGGGSPGDGGGAPGDDD